MSTVINNLNGLLLRECNWSVTTAGPSPHNNQRTELFLLGCKKAMRGNPCKGCFNSTTWDSSKAEFSHDPIDMAKHINEHAPNKYITIGGGEPTDQIDNLTILCRELKSYGFHIVMYTWKELKPTLKMNAIATCNITPESIFCDKMNNLMQYVDIVVDGEYKQEERLWDGAKSDGLISSVGSGNQIVWDIKRKRGFSMRDLEAIFLDESNNLQYILKDLDAEMQKLKY